MRRQLRARPGKPGSILLRCRLLTGAAAAATAGVRRALVLCAAITESLRAGVRHGNRRLWRQWLLQGGSLRRQRRRKGVAQRLQVHRPPGSRGVHYGHEALPLPLLLLLLLLLLL